MRRRSKEPVEAAADAAIDVPEPAPDPEMTVIGPAARLEGLIVSGGPLRVEGEVQGEIRADGDLVIAPNAVVEAEVRAASLLVEGVYHGNAEIEGRAELARTARVSGSIACRVLVVAEGAVFDGATRMTGDAPVIDLPEARAGKDR